MTEPAAQLVVSVPSALQLWHAVQVRPSPKYPALQAQVDVSVVEPAVQLVVSMPSELQPRQAVQFLPSP